MTRIKTNITLQQLSRDLEAFVFDYRRLMLADYDLYDLTVTMVVVVTAVAQGASSLTVLAKQLHMMLPQATLALNKLEERGLITRGIEPSDKRKAVLSLSEAGQAMIEHVQAQREQRLQDFYNALGEEEREQFTLWFNKLWEGMKKPFS